MKNTHNGKVANALTEFKATGKHIWKSQNTRSNNLENKVKQKANIGSWDISWNEMVKWIKMVKILASPRIFQLTSNS